MADWQYKGTNGRIAQGGHVALPDIEASEDNGGNAWIQNRDGEKLWLWVDDFTVGFSMGGGFAQSKYRRSFFARNFVQPKFMVRGQMPNSFQYQRLAEFVRESQLDMLNNKTLRAADSLMGFTLHEGGQAGVSDHQKGHHEGYHMRGYISKIDRGAERWVNAPTFQFEFTLAYSYVGLFRTEQALARDLAAWTEVFLNGNSFTLDPDGPAPNPVVTPGDGPRQAQF